VIQRSLAGVGGLLLGLSACDPCDGARVRIAGADGEVSVDVCAGLSITEDERRTGLLGRSSLDDGTGLLLVFPVTGEACITGEGMEFAIDVVFIDEGPRVVAVEALGAFDARSICEPGVRYVLEVSRGESGGAAPGDRVSIEGGGAPP